MAHVLIENTLDDFGKKISRSEEAEPRLTDMLENTPQLAQAIFNPEVPHTSRRLFLQMVLEHDEINRQLVESVDDPWELVAKHIAALKGPNQSRYSTSASGGSCGRAPDSDSR